LLLRGWWNWFGRNRLRLLNRVHVDDNRVAVATGDAEYIEMSPGSVGIEPDIVVARLNKSQIVFRHKPAGIDFVQGNRRGRRHIEKFSRISA
jgi:hypothetical protein